MWPLKWKLLSGSGTYFSVYYKQKYGNSFPELWRLFGWKCKVIHLILVILDYLIPRFPNTCFVSFQIKNFTFQYKIKKIQHKEKRNYYSTTDTVQVWEAMGRFNIERCAMCGGEKGQNRLSNKTRLNITSLSRYRGPVLAQTHTFLKWRHGWGLLVSTFS